MTKTVKLKSQVVYSFPCQVAQKITRTLGVSKRQQIGFVAENYLHSGCQLFINVDNYLQVLLVGS